MRPIAEPGGNAVRGIREQGLAVFRGIPYAAPPVGELRWQPARPHPGWAGTVRDAEHFGPSAPQPYAPAPDPVLGRHGEPPFSEDCLTLNVWTPGLEGKRPVLVWIHGGGFLSGSGSLPYYAGDTFARDGDFVVVTINYRLGALGYLYTGAETGNYWFTDQLMALRWVHENIAAFGGDPGQVTVAGQSGGAFSTAALACHPEAAPLFRRMILQSPPFGLELPDRAGALARTEQQLRAAGVDSIDELRELPPERLIASLPEMAGPFMRFGHWPTPYLPVLDDATVRRHPAEALADVTDKDILIGWTADEATFGFAFHPMYAAITEEQALTRFTETFGERAEDAYTAYAAARPDARPADLLIQLIGDDLFRVPAVNLADVRAGRGRPVWAYQFDYRTPAHDGRLGTPHCLDLPFTFDNPGNWSNSPFLAGVEFGDLADTMHSAWINFIRTGDPHLPDWTPSTLPDRTIMRFDTKSGVSGDPVPFR
ncbi:carboxylesterase/lipase family protein [Nocardia concava]|uniref:carboxylesterase/lipase family protein n=1 Tax=Nocardia concava TaxID=257281 RepID=UPI000594B9FF|nr:carboxylesterase family protein [Nocardia concava]